MRLKSFLDEKTDAEFGRLIKTSRVAIGRYRRGESMPGALVAERIVKATNGQVTIQDLHDAHVDWLHNQQAVAATGYSCTSHKPADNQNEKHNRQKRIARG